MSCINSYCKAITRVSDAATELVSSQRNQPYAGQYFYPRHRIRSALVGPRRQPVAACQSKHPARIFCAYTDITMEHDFARMARDTGTKYLSLGFVIANAHPPATLPYVTPYRVHSDPMI